MKKAVMIRRRSILQHFIIQNELWEQETNHQKSFYEMRVVQNLNTMLVFYNMIFIPLQFGFRIPFKGLILALEIITILLYLTEIGLRVHTIMRLKKLETTQLSLIKTQADRKLLANLDSLNSTL